MKITETQVARPVVAYFSDMGYDVYQEVKINGREAVADIIATLGKRVVIVECKTSLSLAVIEQAVGWRGFANWVYVATPMAREIKGRWVASSILKYFGIGHIEVAVFSEQCAVRLAAVLDRKAQTGRVLKSLVEAHRTYAEAGNCTGRHWSPFKQTCENLLTHVRNNPGCTIKAAIGSIQHHYATPSTAVASLATWIVAGKVPGLCIRFDEHHKRRLYIVDAQVTPC